MREIFNRWPKLIDAIACEEIADLPSPVVPLKSLDNKRAWMKCDNLVHSVYGGNKVRKLEFIIPELKRKKIREVITMGGVGTNSGVAVSMVCHQLDIPCRIYVFDQEPSDTLRKNLELMTAFHANLIPVGNFIQAGLRYYLDWRRLDPQRYFLYAGCSNAVSVFGYVNALLELKKQVDAGLCPPPDHIVLATGSCSTQAGLLLGSALLDWPLRITGVRVAPEYVGPIPACTPALVTKLMQDALSLMQEAYPEYASLVLPIPQLTGDYYGKGYGIPTAASIQAMAIAREQENLSLEATYTGKAFAAFLDVLANSHDRVLFWNTHNSQETGALRRGANLASLPQSLQAYRA